MRKLIALAAMTWLSFAAMPAAEAQQTPSVTRILFLLDGSSSMAESWSSTTKIDAARSIIENMADSLSRLSGVQLALRIYGHQYSSIENNCTDTRLEVPFASHNATGIGNALSLLRPKGTTPIAYSLEQCANDFPSDPHARNVVILVTDGIESCNGDPCEVSLRLQQKHIFLRPFVIGLSLTPSESEKMACIGNFYNTQDPSSLRSMLSRVVQRILSSSTVQVNLLDNENRPLETDVDMTFYDAASGACAYNYYHTINNAGLPDTLQIDPVTNYDLTIHTTPPITRHQLNFPAGKTDTVNIPASQGFLKMELQGTAINQNLNDKIKTLVRLSGSSETLVVLNLNETQKLLSGTYDLEVLTLPRMQVKHVIVTQSTVTTIKIPLPGIVSVSKSFPLQGAIMMMDAGKWVKIYGLNENLNSELIGLQPGTYQLIFRSKFSKRTTESAVRKFEIKSGQTTFLNL